MKSTNFNGKIKLLRIALGLLTAIAVLLSADSLVLSMILIYVSVMIQLVLVRYVDNKRIKLVQQKRETIKYKLLKLDAASEELNRW